MLKTIQIDNYYEVRVESSNKLIGKFVQDVDGFFYFSQEERDGGLWSDYILLEVGSKLKQINEPWLKQIEKYFEENESSHHAEDFQNPAIF